MLVDKLDAKQLWGHIHIDTKSMEDETNDTLREGGRKRERKRGEGERGEEERGRKIGGKERGGKNRESRQERRKAERKREGGEEGEGRIG